MSGHDWGCGGEGGGGGGCDANVDAPARRGEKEKRVVAVGRQKDVVRDVCGASVYTWRAHVCCVIAVTHAHIQCAFSV